MSDVSDMLWNRYGSKFRAMERANEIRKYDRKLTKSKKVYCTDRFIVLTTYRNIYRISNIYRYIYIYIYIYIYRYIERLFSRFDYRRIIFHIVLYTISRKSIHVNSFLQLLKYLSAYPSVLVKLWISLKAGEILYYAMHNKNTTKSKKLSTQESY